MDDAEAQLTAMFQAHAARVYAFARRSTDAAGAEEVVSETFLVAWRKIDQVPADPLPWLLVTARFELLRHRRSHRRRLDLEVAVRQVLGTQPLTDDVAASVAAREIGLAALAGLSERDREALLLIAWDGLTPSQAAEVQGCTPQTFQVRLHRARRRFEAAAGEVNSFPAPRTDEVTA